MRKAPNVASLGPRYDQEEGRSSVVAPHERQGQHASTRLSLSEGWRLVRTPASENGIYEYYRVLLDRPPEPEGLLGRMRALHVGGSMRLDVLAGIANSDEARRRGVAGPGLRLINLVTMLARRSGFAGRVRRRRFNRALVELLERSATGGPPARAEFRVSEPEPRANVPVESGAPAEPPDGEVVELDELSDRVAAMEMAVLELLNARARELRKANGRGAPCEPDRPGVTALRAGSAR